MRLPETITLPLKADEYGIIRVSGTRVTLESLIAFYHQGESPQDLHEEFPTVPLADIYLVIAYYLANCVEVDEYRHRQDEKAARLREEWEVLYPPLSKAELLARREAARRQE